MGVFLGYIIIPLYIQNVFYTYTITSDGRELDASSLTFSGLTLALFFFIGI